MLSNADSPIYVTELGIETEVRPEFENACLEILVTESGIVIDVRLEVPEKV